MRYWPFAIFFFFLTLTGARAQFGSFNDVPIEINAEQTSFENGIAVAQDNVVIRYGTVLIYCDYAQYNPETRDVLVQGNVRIYREGRLFTGERALYNLETKVLNAADFRGDFSPFRFGGDTLSTIGSNAYLVKGGLFTTSDNSKPDYFLRAKSVRIYPNDRIIFSDVRLYVGRTPIFWFPYLYQSLDKEQSFTITPGYKSVWGAYLLGTYSFPIADNWHGKLRLDLLSDRGVGVGFDSDWGSKGGRNWGRFRTYAIDDSNPGTNKTALHREPIDSGRYRISFQDRTYITDDIYASIDINKLSDARVLQDFDEGAFRLDPNPDNMIAVTKWNEDYTVTLLGRKNLNEENFDATERLPELSLDYKRQPFFKTPVFYENETSAGFLRRNFAQDSVIPDYDTFRADTFHQWSLPLVLGKWLSIIPRVGFRGTYYTDSGTFSDEIRTFMKDSGEPGKDPKIVTEETRVLHSGGSVFRPVINAGFETSFKLSKAYEQVQSRAWGLDGLRHVVQPFMNFSYVSSGKDPRDLLQFDERKGSTQPAPIDFPEFNSVDSIDDWTILRLGVRNRWQTRRDNQTINWLEVNSFFDVRFDQPDFGQSLMPDEGTFSNLVTRMRWEPVPWINVNFDSQLPVFDKGFTELNSNINFMVNPDLELYLGHRYLSGNELFNNDNALNVGAYLRLGENWAFSIGESYRFDNHTLQSQRYELHRDLSSWVGSVGVVVRDNSGVSDVGVLLTFTLKDFPNVRLPLSVDAEDLVSGSGGSGKNR